MREKKNDQKTKAKRNAQTPPPTQMVVNYSGKRATYIQWKKKRKNKKVKKQSNDNKENIESKW